MIIYFSGTGNTRLVVCELLKHFDSDEQVLEVTGRDMFQDEYEIAYSDCNDKRVIWAFPTHSWGIPAAMAEFMTKVKVSEQFANCRHYMVVTCGDDVGLIDRQWRKILNERGWSAMSAHSVIMPNTYVFLKGFDVDTPEVVAKKIGQMPEIVAKIADSIKSDSSIDTLLRGAFPWVKTKVIYPLFKRYAISSKPFYVNEKCTSCGLCVKSCPLGNISFDSARKPHWGNECTMCLRCFHICSQNAVQYGRVSKGKGQKKVYF